MNKSFLFIMSDTSHINDEGKQKTFKNIYLNSKRFIHSKAISRKGKKIDHNHQIVQSNKFLISFKFIKSYRDRCITHLIYFPNESLSLGTILRITSFILFKQNKTKIIVVICQHKEQNLVNTIIIKNIIKIVKIKILSFSKEYERNFGNGYFERILLTGVNSIKYNRINLIEKEMLRKKWGYSINDFIVLHVGHLAENRNYNDLIELSEKVKNISIIVVSSNFHKGYFSISDKIIKSNINLINTYIEDISEIYKISDLYVFMVKDESGAISMPLSIIEALSCGIPVLSRRFGLVPDMLSSHSCVYFYDSPEELVIMVNEFINKIPKCLNNNIRQKYEWDNIVNEFVKQILSYP